MPQARQGWRTQTNEHPPPPACTLSTLSTCSLRGLRALRRRLPGKPKLDPAEHRFYPVGSRACGPAGELLDTVRSKRAAVVLGALMIAAAALLIALWPAFPSVLTALALRAITGGFLGLAVAAISLGLVGHAALGERLGRNQRFASTGGVLAAGLMGLVSYFLSYRAIFFTTAALVLPLLAALGYIRTSDIHYGSACGAGG